MGTDNTRHFVCCTAKTAVVVFLISLGVGLSGCTAISLFLSEGPFEKKIDPVYDLHDQQERKVMIWIECPYSADADFDVQETLALTYQLYLTEKAGFKAENIILRSPVDDGAIVDPKGIARSHGAGYLLVVQVDSYSADFLRIRDLYAGELITRAVLFDLELGSVVWPSQPEGKMVHISVEMEDGGREALVSRLSSAAAHCTLRYLYPCEKLKFDSVDERVSLQEAYEIETY